MVAAAAERALTSYHWLGIPIALAGAILLSLGTLFQHRGVDDSAGKPGPGRGGGMGGGRLRRLVRRPAWLAGTGMLAGAVVLQLTALRFSPLIVVQPIGAFALVVTTLATARTDRAAPGRRTVVSVLLCVAGVAAFVAVAAVSAQDAPISDRHLAAILILLGAVLALLGAGFALLHRRWNAAAYTVAAGVQFGFVAALAKTVIARILQGDFEWLSLTCVAGLGAAAGFGAYLVQNAHTRGSSELVVAGLTVVDPLVAVTIGIAVLGEADTAPPQAFAGFVLAGAVAVAGVISLATVHARGVHAPSPRPPAPGP
ncbi:multidrug DMT transporter permease [Sinomonas terrae]|uniref:Multidrug DMT transporter permease n=1 Tax=Sinomonas terrae TaxID=2908838 RepID=A0ABS9U6W1_9MICC|nr:multidrug DMT transporter permease [Sinomonas terrae]MCH6472426.1 multidrug DMT transporter permease [Sinomonas terrae]